MKVRIDRTATAAPHVFQYLDRILNVLIEGRHIWDERDPGAVEQSVWVAGDAGRAGRRVREAIEKLLGAQLYEGRHARGAGHMHTLVLTVTLAGAPPFALTPSDAVTSLELPAVVVVENRESDGAFLDAMANAFGRDALRNALRKGFLEVHSGGGSGEIPKRVKEIIRKMGHGPRRLLILSDSDRLFPGQCTRTEKKIAECAKEHGVCAVILRKREAENYLPYEALWDMSGKKERCNAFLQLSPRQRDHYDMKQGFRRNGETGEAEVPVEQRELYEAVKPRRVLDALIGGFGPAVWRCFLSDKVTEASVRALCEEDAAEIVDLLDSIERLA